jgi:hypothetical protein
MDIIGEDARSRVRRGKGGGWRQNIKCQSSNVKKERKLEVGG